MNGVFIRFTLPCGEILCAHSKFDSQVFTLPADHASGIFGLWRLKEVEDAETVNTYFIQSFEGKYLSVDLWNTQHGNRRRLWLADEPREWERWILDSHPGQEEGVLLRSAIAKVTIYSAGYGLPTERRRADTCWKSWPHRLTFCQQKHKSTVQRYGVWTMTEEVFSEDEPNNNTTRGAQIFIQVHSFGLAALQLEVEPKNAICFHDSRNQANRSFYIFTKGLHVCVFKANPSIAMEDKIFPLHADGDVTESLRRISLLGEFIDRFADDDLFVLSSHEMSFCNSEKSIVKNALERLLQDKLHYTPGGTKNALQNPTDAFVLISTKRSGFVPLVQIRQPAGVPIVLSVGYSWPEGSGSSGMQPDDLVHMMNSLSINPHHNAEDVAPHQFVPDTTPNDTGLPSELVPEPPVIAAPEVSTDPSSDTATITPDPPPKAPYEYLCPIGGQIMIDPVQNAAGHTYEKCNIFKWLHELGKRTDPMTNQRLDNLTLSPNHNLRSLIATFLETYPEHPEKCRQANSPEVQFGENDYEGHHSTDNESEADFDMQLGFAFRDESSDLESVDG